MPTVVFLFQDSELQGHLKRLVFSIRAEVDKAPEDHVLHADEAEWAKALAERYTVELPDLRDQLWMDDPQSVWIDVSKDPSAIPRPDGSIPPARGHRTVIHIPYTGDGTIFQLRPTNFTMNPPRGAVTSNELLLVVEYPDYRPKSFTDEADAFIKQVNRHLALASRDVNPFNTSLENVALTIIKDRRENILAHRAHVDATGLPIGPPRDPSKTYIADVIVRKPSPRRAPREGPPIKLEPVLAQEEYEYILAVIRQHALSMEKNPKTYVGMGEEARRHVILDALNTHYDGAGSAEAFNFGGKTDIAIRAEGRNIFIAECKRWDGAIVFTATLDQLFGYQAWRDTKLAILMFVEQRDVTAIIERGRAALDAHEQFVEWQDAASKTELRATVHWKGDERQLAELNVFFISTPLS